MNLNKLATPLRTLAFSIWRYLAVRIPGARIRAFGAAAGQIGAIRVINLDRQRWRWTLVTRELARFRTSDNLPLTAITQRLSAIDARDGRSAAATSDVDVMYRVGDQLHVQPDARLAECFSADEPVRMTRQEVAVARSHIEAWKAVAGGPHRFVLVLEDDVWFTPGASAAIDRGWQAALNRGVADGGPKLFYVSYSDAGGTAAREDVADGIFRPVRGLWFLSGYVLSREGAACLLRAMPVVGPVDLWMNFRFAELGALALSSPAIAQRWDAGSDNSYSMMPYLARAGIVDAAHRLAPPGRARTRLVLAWSDGGAQEHLAMALSMLGLRVRVFDGNEPPMHERDLRAVFETFDAVVDAPLVPGIVAALCTDKRFATVLEVGGRTPAGLDRGQLPAYRSALVGPPGSGRGSWDALCAGLGLEKPVDEFPLGAPRSFRMFRHGRSAGRPAALKRPRLNRQTMDDSPWTLPPTSGWEPTLETTLQPPIAGLPIVRARMAESSPDFHSLVETFPGNLASFAEGNLEHLDGGTRLTIETAVGGRRPYRSGAFASVSSFSHGRIEADIRTAPGAGLVTGFFLHRANPLQEIDIEFPGSDPRRMLANVYFNPGDDGTAMSFGYRGSPCWIDLGFDASAEFHHYAIDWRPGRIAWLLDGRVVHERLGWDPTPIPHLPMRVHGNVWAPRSEELAGRVDQRMLPSHAVFRNVLVRS